ncbi:MAG: restriction endonuclease [bacterium]
MDLNEAMKQLDATEANLVKLEKLWKEIRSLIPEVVCFDGDDRYDDRCRQFNGIVITMPKIDGFAITYSVPTLHEIAQMRLTADRVNEIECYARTENVIYEQEKALKEYRYRLARKRRAVIREEVLTQVKTIGQLLKTLVDENPYLPEDRNHKIDEGKWAMLARAVSVIDHLLGSDSRPTGWSELSRHVSWGELCDLHDIASDDWPAVSAGLHGKVYSDLDPLPVGVGDLSELNASVSASPVVTALKWESLDGSGFEGLIFNLISEDGTYENPEWVTRTNAPDRGRDLSATRVIRDSLTGTLRYRVMIQCKHWQRKSIGPRDVGEAKEQMKSWGDPRVDILVLATSGRFTTDAVTNIEKHNQSDSALRIEMWADSHLEKLLASRPALVAEFGLR